MPSPLSKLLLELYRGSRKIEPECFQEWLFEAVGQVVPIDGGSWVTGVQVGEVPPMQSYYLYHFSDEMIRDYVDIWHQDPLHVALEASPGETISLSRPDYEGRPAVIAFMEKHGVGSVLATRVVDPISKLRTVISFSRKPGAPSFTEEERLFKQNLMLHLIEVWTENRLMYALKCSENERQNAVASAAAVVDNSAILHVAEDFFSELIREEWPEWEGPRLPEALLQDLIAGEAMTFVGQRVVVARIGTIRDQFLLRIRRKGAYDRLGERERQIARLVSDGLSQKEIARHCGISPATVNNHMAKIYLKLGIGDKAQLAKVLALFE